MNHYVAKTFKEYDQSFFDPILLMRVGEKDSKQAQDVGGTTSLFNASILGSWQIEYLGLLGDEANNKIEDIILELFIAFRWN